MGTDGGWSTHGIHPPVLGFIDPTLTIAGFIREFMAFTPDLCSAWLIDYQSPPLTEDGARRLPQSLPTRQLRAGRRRAGSAGAGTAAAATRDAGDLRGQHVGPGHSEDGRHAFFVANAKLTEEAASGTNSQTYDRFEGENHLVSVLPDGSAGDPASGDGKGFANPGPSGVGSGWSGSLESAVSAEGSRVYWTGGNQQIYLREYPEQGIVASECIEDAACTIKVSGGGGAFFWGAAPDGSAALYSEGEDLFVFDLESETSEPVAEDVSGVAGHSEDLSRIYFVSDTALSGAGANSEEDEAQPGEPNLYLTGARRGQLHRDATRRATWVRRSRGRP